MKMGITEEGIAVRSLQKDEIPAIIGIVKLVRHLLEKFHFSGKAEAKVLANFESPISWLHRGDISHEALMVVRSSCKAMHAFITALYEGKWDHVFHEMADNGWRKKSVAGLANYPKFRLHEDVESVFNREKVQQDNALKFAASDETRPEVLAASSQIDTEIDDEEFEVEVDNKETKLRIAREKHVQGALNDAVRLVKRPCLKSDYVSLFNESLLVQNRQSFVRDGPLRHGWLYDCCADQEPHIAEKARHGVKTVPPQPDVPVAKMFFEAVLTVAKRTTS